MGMTPLRAASVTRSARPGASAANAVDSTAETQAYYAAEAGLQAAVNALRGNAAHTGSALPTGMTTINFRNAVIASSSNDCPNGVNGDPTAVARLSRWLPYSNTQTAGTRVTVGTSPTIQYDVVVSLPPGDVLPASPAEPGRLLIQATGYGPNSSRKQMSMIVARAAFDPMVPSMMTLVGTPTGSPPMSFDSGNSANHIYSGVDHAGAASCGVDNHVRKAPTELFSQLQPLLITLLLIILATTSSTYHWIKAVLGVFALNRQQLGAFELARE